MEEKEVLNLEEASALLGVSMKTLQKILREEEIPARKIGREWRFSRTALLRWLAEGNSQQYSAAEQIVREYFDQLAPEYDASRVKCYGNDLRNLLMDKVAVTAGMRVADIGCGTGYLTKALAERAEEVMAVDASREMLNVARREMGKAGLHNIRFLQGAAEELPLSSDHYDLVFANMLLHHLSDPGEALREFCRILKPGGQVILTDVEEHRHTWVKQEKSDLWLGFHAEELTDWFGEAGFVEAKVEKLGCDCFTTGSQGQSAHIPIILATGKKSEKGR